MDEIRTFADFDDSELMARTGALATEGCRNAGFIGEDWHRHWESMQHTAIVAILAAKDKSKAYAYSCARYAIKGYMCSEVGGIHNNYRKEVVANGYTLMELEKDIQEMWPTEQIELSSPWDAAVNCKSPFDRPVEAQAAHNMNYQHFTSDLRETARRLVYAFAGMMSNKWEPEAVMRRATVCAMRLHNYTYEECAAAAGISDPATIRTLYNNYSRRFLRPFAEATPLMQETLLMRGQDRVIWHDELTAAYLRNPEKKTVIGPNGRPWSLRYQDWKEWKETSCVLRQEINGAFLYARLGGISEVSPTDFYRSVNKVTKSAYRLNVNLPVYPLLADYRPQLSMNEVADEQYSVG